MNVDEGNNIRVVNPQKDKCKRLCIKVGRGQGNRDIGTRVWGLGTRDEGLEDIKYGTRGRGHRDIKYRDAGDAECE